MELLIREMMPEEAGIVYKVEKSAFTGFERLLVPKPKKALVAIKDGEIAGAILYKYLHLGKKKVGYFDYAFVSPSHHAEGIGTVLYRAMADTFRENGCDAQAALIKDDNVASFGLMIKNGLVRVSLPEAARLLGWFGMLMLYFTMPIGFAIGMDFYLSDENESIPHKSKENSAMQILFYLLSNALLLSTSFFLHQNGVQLIAASITLLLFCAAAEYAVSRFTKRRKWSFRLNNGGLFISLLVNISSFYPLTGNFYPDRYENADAFRKDLGLLSLTSWLLLLAVTASVSFSGSNDLFLQYLGRAGVFLLMFRSIPYYPFESYGGARVYRWNRPLFFAMALLSIAVILSVFML